MLLECACGDVTTPRSGDAGGDAGGDVQPEECDPSEVQRPLATVVVGGLLTSTSMTLVVLPVLYTMFARRRTEVES